MPYLDRAIIAGGARYDLGGAATDEIYEFDPKTMEFVKRNDIKLRQDSWANRALLVTKDMLGC